MIGMKVELRRELTLVYLRQQILRRKKVYDQRNSPYQLFDMFGLYFALERRSRVYGIVRVLDSVNVDLGMKFRGER